MVKGTSGAEIVIVGDEVVSGQVVDTNSAFIARSLKGIGLETHRVVRVRDDESEIKRAVASALVSSRLVFVCGGLGVTPDDRTLNAVSELLERKLIVHKPSLDRIKTFFERQGYRIQELAKRHALVPAGARVFENPVGMVPGMVVEHQNSTICLLPGVPQELSAILEQGIIPYLKQRFGSERKYSAVLRTFGLIESRSAPRVTGIVREYPGVSVGYYPSVAGLDIILSGEDEAAVNRCADKLTEVFGERVYALKDKGLAEVVGEMLRKAHLTLGTAESCTGGLVGDIITGVKGSSDYYLGGVIAYSNRTKMNVLGVREKTLARYGAVSSQTVKEMAKGVCAVIGTDCGIAVSGIAGPGGGTKEKPVGLVYIGVNFREKLWVEKHLFSGTRRVIKERSAYSALDLLRRVLLKGL